jgi:predicted DNA-binding transcriptional regulator YafY
MKKISRPQYARIRRILALIREGPSSPSYAAAGTAVGRLPNARDFGRALGVSRPTVMRDLDWLRDEENAPIEYVPSRHGYRLADQSWSLPPIQLSKREVFAFSIATKLIGAFRGTALDLDMESVLSKIAESLEGNITLDPESLSEHLTVVGEDYVAQDPEVWSAVAKATDRRERIEIVYQRFSGEVKEYALEPYHLPAYHGNWYVIGNNTAKGRVATFAVSRVRSIRLTGSFFEIGSDFDIEEHIRHSFGIVRGEKAFRVRLLFSRNVATYIRERVWHPSQKIVNKRDGGIELSFETAGWKELVRWVLSWQPDCRVLSPRRLRERVEEKMRMGLNL